MRLCADPFSKPYVEYLLRVNNGQESSIINHFPPEADAEPSIEIKIALHPEIHQAPSLDTFIHVVFPALAINTQTKVHGWSSYSDNKKYSREFF
jgi:hypothetical protein